MGKTTVATTKQAAAPAEQKMDPIVMLNNAIEKGADPEVIGKFMDLQERFEKQEASKAFTDAMAAFQDECPVIQKTREVNMRGGSYLYASYDDIMKEIQPLLTKYGISVSFSMEMVEGAAKMTCTVAKGIHSQVSTFTCPVPKEMKVNDSQKMGSARSYAKRYALEDALNIVVSDEDDDGRGLVQTITDEQADELRQLADAIPEEMLPKFFKVMQVPIGGWQQIPADRYLDAKNKLVTKAHQLEQERQREEEKEPAEL